MGENTGPGNREMNAGKDYHENLDHWLEKQENRNIRRRKWNKNKQKQNYDSRKSEKNIKWNNLEKKSCEKNTEMNEMKIKKKVNKWKYWKEGKRNNLLEIMKRNKK